VATTVVREKYPKFRFNPFKDGGTPSIWVGAKKNVQMMMREGKRGSA